MAQVRRHVFVTVGTDHHRFDRLITWVESWVPPDGIDVEVLVQHGSSRTPERLPACAFLDSDALRSAVTSADVVVTQGGPGGIMDARRAGIMPVVVPRSSGLGESVDDHQIAFARHIASLGEVVVAASEPELHRALDAGVLDPDIYRTDAAPATSPETIAAFGQLVEQVVQQPPRGLRGRLPSFAALRRRSAAGTQLSHP
jgi:UDP-N-acetylglucosamine transferase subunit ALG13